jgi:hypothetical protein
VKAPPRLLAFHPWFDLVRLHVGLREHERFRQVVPDGGAGEVGHLDGIPRSADIHEGTRKGLPWIQALLYHLAIDGRDRHAFGSYIQNRRAVLGGEGLEPDVLAVRIDRDGLFVVDIGPAARAPEWAAERHARGNAGNACPILLTAMRVQNRRK